MVKEGSRNAARVSAQVERYKRWLRRETVDRPMFGLFWEPDMAPLPGFVDRVEVGAEISPDMIEPEMCLDAVEKWYERGAGLAQDTFQPFMPGFGIPWTEAIAGCSVVAQPGSLWAQPVPECYTDRSPIRLERDNPWVVKLVEFLAVLARFSHGRFPITLPALRGPLDTLAAMRTPERMCLDLVEQPEHVRAILRDLTRLYIDLNELLLRDIPPFAEGYVSRLHMWAPDKVITPQNDVSAMISPAMYARFVLPGERQIMAQFPYQSYHLHSTERHIVGPLLTVDRLSAMQMTLEHTLGGPGLEITLPVARRILEQKPLILVMYDLTTAERCLQELPYAGLCLMLAPELTQDTISGEYSAWLGEHCSQIT